MKTKCGIVSRLEEERIKLKITNRKTNIEKKEYKNKIINYFTIAFQRMKKWFSSATFTSYKTNEMTYSLMDHIGPF